MKRNNKTNQQQKQSKNKLSHSSKHKASFRKILGAINHKHSTACIVVSIILLTSVFSLGLGTYYYYPVMTSGAAIGSYGVSHYIREFIPPLWVASKKIPIIGPLADSVIGLSAHDADAEFKMVLRKMISVDTSSTASTEWKNNPNNNTNTNNSNINNNINNNNINNTTITIMTYNVLAECYTTVSRYSHCPEFARRWSFRGSSILKEIYHYQPDVLCLQEVDHFSDFFEPKLKMMGYKGVYIKRTGMRLDGCAIFFKTNKMELIQAKNIEYNDLAREGVNGIDKSHLHKDNVGLVLHLKTKQHQQHQHDQHHQHAGDSDLFSKEFYVATTHFFWDPKFAHVKAEQAKMLLRSVSSIAGFDVPIFIAGDFNSVPNSDVYQHFHNHTLEIASAYASLGEPQTHFTPHYFGCLDYIWHTKKHATIRAILEPIANDIWESKDIFPSVRFPSDHLPLMAAYDLL